MLSVVLGPFGKPLAKRLRALRRDLEAVATTLAGRPMPAVVERRGGRRAPQAIAPRRMRVAQVVRETRDAVSLVLEDERGAPVAFAPGQFFTLYVVVGADRLKRAYSASSSALDTGRVAVTVKRIEGGRVSTHLVENAKQGDVLDVLGPSGSFTPAATAEARSLVLVGGGSGITPLMSIARTVLVVEPTTRVVLIYGNGAIEHVIFRDAIDALARQYPGRFVVRHVIERAPADWTGETGQLGEEALARALGAAEVTDAPNTEYFVCGPEPMMQAVRTCLLGRGVAPARIREERFLATHAADDAPREAQAVTMRMRNGERRVVVPPGKTVLEAALDDGLPMPFSCTVGGCGACRVRLLEGRVSMAEPNCLTSEERAQGHILACVSRPAGPCVVEVP
jgi:ring-1,2-phenylacetyl-CoA epoxidase subunit PaaE